MIDRQILGHLVKNEKYARAVLPHLKSEYFLEAPERLVFDLVCDYTNKYGTFPTKEALFVDLDLKNDGINEDRYKKAWEVISEIQVDDATDLPWLIDKTEEFCKNQALEIAIRTAIEAMDKDSKVPKGALPHILQEALQVSFDIHIGHDFIEDAAGRFASYHEVHKRIGFDIEEFNKITNGGLKPKTLNCLMATTGVGKAQPDDTMIPTPYGSKRMDSLSVGDVIFGSDGKMIIVNGVYPQGEKEVYEIVFADGRTARCCREHLWNVSVADGNNRGFITMSTEEIMERMKSPYQAKRIHIQLSEPISYIAQNLEIDPYVLGAILGDGHIGEKQLTITNPDREVIDGIQQRLPQGYHLIPCTNPITYNIVGHKGSKLNIVRHFLKRYGLQGRRSWEKFIPHQFKMGSIEQRFDVLRGLLDTDGTIGTNGAISYATTSPRLAHDIADLVRSLGGYAKISEAQIKKYTNKNGNKVSGRPSYRVGIRMRRDVPIFTIQHRLERFKKEYQYENLKLRILSINKIGNASCRCIKVSAADSLYVTENYVVTHNTMVMCHMAASNFMEGKKVLYLTLEMAEEQISKRIDQNLLDLTEAELLALSETQYVNRVKALTKLTRGQIIVKEYPPASANANHFKALLADLKMKRKFIPDIIYVDYLNLCNSTRVKGNAGQVGSYTIVKWIAEEIRGLAVEHDVPIMTATQANRGAIGSNDMGLENTSESIGLPQTVDLMLGLMADEDMIRMNQMTVKQLKNRYNDPNNPARFRIGVDRSKMKLFSLESAAGDDVPDEVPIMDNSSLGIGAGDYKSDIQDIF